MIIAGVDYSITCPTICIYDSGVDFTFENCKFFSYQKIDSRKKREEIRNIRFKNITVDFQETIENLTERYLNIATWAINIVLINKVDIVAMEAYSMGSRGRVFEIAEATGCFKTYLFTNGKIPLTLFSPSSIKKEFCGKGNADKSIMSDAFFEKEKIHMYEEFGLKNPKDSPSSDVIDSFAVVNKFLNMK